MRRAFLLVVVVVVVASCLDFERRVTNCFDGGVCSASVSDGGANTDGGEAFVPFDAGFFCTGEFCWESPFPHGVTLNTVYADGDDLVVAGEHGMLAERRGGRWSSFQGTGSLTTEWQVLWGTSRDDVWLTGGPKAWHRTASGWSTVGAQFPNANCQGVTGFDGGIFMSASSEVYELRNGAWDTIFTATDSDVQRLTTAFGALHASLRLSANNTAGQVSRIPSGPAWVFDGGATFTLVSTSKGLLATGSRTVLLDQTMQAQQLPVVLEAAVEANGELLGAVYGELGVVTDRGLRLETEVVGVRAMAAGSTAVAVGSGGLILERRDGGWVDPTPTVTRSNVVAFVERSGTLFALTADCSLLERGPTTWTKRSLPMPMPLPMPDEGCFDVATDGTSFFVLSTTSVVFFDAALAVTGFSTLPAGLEVKRLWRSDSGALVVTTATGVFVRQPAPTSLFVPVQGLGGAWGVSGRGSVARVCGLAQDKVVDLDLSQSPPGVTEVAGLLAPRCRAVLPLRNGQWALAARDGSLPQVRLVAANGSTNDVVLDGFSDKFIEALAETPKGIAVATDGYAFIPLANTQLVRPAQGFGDLRAVTVWGGRVFVGGAGGAILQAPAP